MPKMLRGSLFKLVVVMMLATTLLDFLHLEDEGIRLYSPVLYGGPAVLPAWFPSLLAPANPEDDYGGFPWNLIYISQRLGILLYIMVIARIDGSRLSGDGCSERVENMLEWFFYALLAMLVIMLLSDYLFTCVDDFAIFLINLVYPLGSAELCIPDDSDPLVSDIKDSIRKSTYMLNSFISDNSGISAIIGEKSWFGLSGADDLRDVILTIEWFADSMRFLTSMIGDILVGVIIFLLPLLAIPKLRPNIKKMLRYLLIYISINLSNKIVFAGIIIVIAMYPSNYVI